MMRVSQNEMLTIRDSTLGGHEAAKLWGDALNALHGFAQRSNCPPGYDVVRWFDERSEAYRTAYSAAIEAAYSTTEDAGQPSQPSDGEGKSEGLMPTEPLPSQTEDEGR